MTACLLLVIKDTKNGFQPIKVIVALNLIHEYFKKMPLMVFFLENVVFHFQHWSDSSEEWISSGLRSIKCTNLPRILA